MFLSSYTPLFIIFAIRFTGWPLRTVCIACAILGTTSLLLLLRRQKATSPSVFQLTAAEPAGGEALSYLTTYLLPFMTIGSPDARDIVAYIVILLVMFTISARTRAIQVNPLLFIFGFIVYSVHDKNGFTGYLIAHKQSIQAPRTISAHHVTNDILLIQTQSDFEPSTS